MACGLPVVTTRVGGNEQVVCRPDLGILSPFWEPAAFSAALKQALEQRWNREKIIEYACSNTWDTRITQLVGVFEALQPLAPAGDRPEPTMAPADAR